MCSLLLKDYSLADDAVLKIARRRNKCEMRYESIAGFGEIEVYLVSKFQRCFIDDFGI